MLDQAEQPGVDKPTSRKTSSTPLGQGLLLALSELDRHLATAEVTAKQLFGSGDAFRGLHISAAEVARLLARAPGQSLFYTQPRAPGTNVEPSEPLAILRDRFRLSAFDPDVLVLALAPELDLRSQRIYAFLQDDVTRRRPSVDLALNLLCETASDRLERRRHFMETSPLRANEVVHLISEPEQPHTPLLARALVVDE